MKADIYSTRLANVFVFVRHGFPPTMPDGPKKPIEPLTFKQTIDLEKATVSDPVKIEADINELGYSVRQEKMNIRFEER